MLWFAQLTDNPDYGYIDNVHFSVSDFLYLSSLIALFLWIVYSKQYKTVVLFLTLCASWLITGMCFSYRQTQEKELVVFSIKHKPAFLYRSGTNIYTSLDSLTNKEKERYIKPYLLSLHQTEFRKLTGNIIQHHNFSLTHMSGQNLVSADCCSDYIIISNNTKINPMDLHKNKPLVIADCSNSYTFVKQLKQQCALADVPFYSVKENGALRISL